jgi:hypothetical protein
MLGDEQSKAIWANGGDMQPHLQGPQHDEKLDKARGNGILIVQGWEQR